MSSFRNSSGSFHEQSQGYFFDSGLALHSQDYLLPPILSVLQHCKTASRRMIDIGCGNGNFSAQFAKRGWEVVGVDPSASAIRFARQSFANIPFHIASGYDDLQARFGQFPVVVSLEVVEHVYDPRAFAATLFNCLEPGGMAIVSTPYHGYWKNLALALSGRMDKHFTALWDDGHIKFWSIASLRILLQEAGFRSIRFLRIGRLPWFAKSMIAIAHREPELNAVPQN